MKGEGEGGLAIVGEDGGVARNEHVHDTASRRKGA